VSESAHLSGEGPAHTGDRPLRVLFVCTGNSARSQMAEAVLRELGGPRFEVFSAGTQPRGIHPLTLRVLAEAGVSAAGLRSKSVDEFRGHQFAFVITVCDRARESCPVFPGAERSLHWGFDDPSDAEGSEEERLEVFRRVLSEITMRMRAFLPIAERCVPA
jgi:thioredoxin type arsenate reductase